MTGLEWPGLVSLQDIHGAWLSIFWELVKDSAETMALGARDEWS